MPWRKGGNFGGTEGFRGHLIPHGHTKTRLDFNTTLQDKGSLRHSRFQVMSKNEEYGHLVEPEGRTQIGRGRRRCRMLLKTLRKELQSWASRMPVRITLTQPSIQYNRYQESIQTSISKWIMKYWRLDESRHKDTNLYREKTHGNKKPALHARWPQQRQENAKIRVLRSHGVATSPLG